MIVPVGLGFVVYFQAKDIHAGSDYCDQSFVVKLGAACEPMLFITSPLLTSFATVAGLVMPVLLIYVRCLKGNFEKEERDEVGDEMKEEKKKKKEEKKRQKEEEKKMKKQNEQTNAFANTNNNNNDFQFGAQQNTYNDFQPTQFTPQNNYNNNNDDMIDFGAIAHDNY